MDQEEALEEVDAGVPATTPGQGQAHKTGEMEAMMSYTDEQLGNGG